MSLPPPDNQTSAEGSTKYPKTTHVGVSNINKDILNSTSPNVWNGGGDVGTATKVSQQSEAVDPSYRKNRVINTELHQIHLNDYENKVVVLHSKGGGIEYGPDGSVTISTPSSRDDYVGNEYTLHVDADGSLTFKGNLKLKVAGDFDIDCVNFNVNASGNKIENIGGSHRSNVAKNYGLQVGEGCSTTVVGQTTNTHLGGYSANIKGTFSNNVDGDANFFASGYTYMTAENNVAISSDNVTISADDMTMQSDTGTIGGENVIMYNYNMHTGHTVWPETMDTNVVYGDLEGTARKAVTADVTNSQNYSDPDTMGSAGNTGSAQGYTVDDTATDTKATALPTGTLLTQWLTRSSGGIRRVKIDTGDFIKKFVNKTENNGGVDDKELTTSRVRSSIRDTANQSNQEFINSSLANGSLHPSYFEKVPEKLGRVVNSGDPFPITSTDPSVLAYQPGKQNKTAVNILPDTKYNPDNVDPQFINSKLKLSSGVSIAKFLGTEDPTNMDWIRNNDDKIALARNYYLHAELIKTIKDNTDGFKDYRLTVAEGLYRPGPGETVTAGSINDLKMKGRAVVYRLIDQTGKTALGRTFDLAAYWMNTQNYEKIILDYDTINNGELDAKVIFILPELKIKEGFGEANKSGWSADFAREVETNYNNSVLSQGDLVEIMQFSYSPATGYSEGTRGWKDATHRYKSDQNVNPPHIGYDGTRGKIDPATLFKVQDKSDGGFGIGPILLSKSGAERFEKLKRAAAKAGFNIRLSAGYRSYYYQSRAYSDRGNAIVAKAGVSRHGLGVAIDIAGCTYKSPLWNWMKANAGKPENGGWLQNDSPYFQQKDPFHWSDTGR